MNTTYLFQAVPAGDLTCVPQISRLLERALETVSRERCPKLWAMTDTLGALPKAPEKTLRRRRIRTRLWSILCLLLGIFLFVPGLMKPQELKGPLLMGAAAIGAGIGGLWRSRNRKKRETRFGRAARQLLVENADTQFEVTFTETYITVLSSAQPDAPSLCPYENLSVFASADLYLLFTEGGTVLLQQKALAEPLRPRFRDFLAAHAAIFDENS